MSKHHAGDYVHGVRGQIPAGSAASLDDLPEEIERDRIEAWECFYAGNLRASIIMARAALQRAVRTLGAQAGGLKAEINETLASDGSSPTTRERSRTKYGSLEMTRRTLRTSVKVTNEEAEVRLQFLDDFVRVAIAMPARAKALRTARKKPLSPGTEHPA
jgi:hypothetical protein